MIYSSSLSVFTDDTLDVLANGSISVFATINFSARSVIRHHGLDVDHLHREMSIKPL